MLDPITHFYQQYDYSAENVKDFICGEKYVAVLFKNGNIGVCATLGQTVKADIPEKIDLKNPEHPIFLNAYFNALLNYNQEYTEEKDIFEVIDFKFFSNIVMVGNFKPVVRRFQEADIPLFIFDKKEDEVILKEMKDQLQYIRKADAIILTATSIYNRSFIQLIENAAENVSVFILGPSAIMHPDMKNYRNVKMIFGSIFEPFDERVLDVIKANQGTRYFSPFSRKVFI
ncbi:MAG: DUF364 domain-containing protein [Bacteroidales bacterium]|jgi:uncharacterized protein (DUF4213/DUF364 family)|nr:DUF364 domain-containing protein [Bacteroidales bacterium]